MHDDSWLTRRRFLQLSGIGLAGMGLYAGEIARHEIEIIHKTVRIRRLPDAFHGYRIVQISDFHFHEYTESFFLRRVVRRVNELAPDAVMLTGDFISTGPFDLDFSRRQAYGCGAILATIECPVRIGIMGNHDAYVGADAVTRALREHQLTILRNQTIPLERDGKRVWVCGLNSCVWKNDNLEPALPMFARVKNEPVVVLVHEPDYIDYMLTEPASQFADLVLSGHTHGGQVRLPFLRPFQAVLPPRGKKYVEGLFRVEWMQLYVNRGIGATGVPFRLNCPPEITVLTLEQGI